MTIGHLNAQTRSVDVDRIGEYVRSSSFDVFVVLDPKQGDVPRLMDAAPGYRVYHEPVRLPENKRIIRSFVRTMVLSRIPIAQIGHPADAAFGKSAVELTTADPTPHVGGGLRDGFADHPGPRPTAGSSPRCGGPVESAHPARRIVMGDFNATPWSPSFQRLLHRGHLFNSLDGFGLQVSWPESNVLLRIPIDHALLGPALAATERGTGPAFGSQHRSLRLTVAGRRP